MTECNGYLYIRTCHTMYKSSDGNNHQANLTLEVRESDMKITDTNYEVASPVTGYVSHSFNQFILADDEQNLIALDHGDGSPRAAALFKYMTKAGESTFHFGTYDECVTRVSVFTFNGVSGDPYTGSSLGGLEYSDSSYLVAGTSIDQDMWEQIDENTWYALSYDVCQVQNIFVTVTSREDFSEEGTEVKWITDYEIGGSITASTPQLVKIDGDTFLLLWMSQEVYHYGEAGDQNLPSELHYVYLDGKGNMISEIYTADGKLSDCKPTVKDGTVVWYVTGDADEETASLPVFYTINADGTFQTIQTSSWGDVDENGKINVSDALAILKAYVGMQSLTTTQQRAGDVDGNGEVNVADALLVLQKYVGLISAFPVEG